MESSICRIARAAAMSAVLTAAALCAPQAFADTSYPTLDTSLTLQADANDGRSSSLSAQSDLNKYWAVSADAGRSRTQITTAATLSTPTSTTEDFTGNSFDGSVSLHNDSFGMRVSGSTWQDSGNYQEHALGLMLSYRVAGFTADLIGDWRSFQIDYTVRILAQTRNREFDFKGQGIGAQLGWVGDHWGVSARYVDYSYGDDLDQLETISQLPNLNLFPHISELVSSAISQSRGALDKDYGAGIDYTLTKSIIHLGVSRAIDAIEGHATDSATLDFHREFGAHFYGDLIAGYSQSPDAISGSDEDLSGGFGGVTIGYNW